LFVCSTSALSGPMPVAQNDPRVSPSFAALGPMYEAADLIWSWVSSRDMNQYNAEKYCKGLGGGARLSTLGEWGALRNTVHHRINPS